MFGLAASAGLLLVGVASATTNIEKQRTDDEGVSGSIQADGAMEFGTVNLVRLETEAAVYWNDGTNHVLVLGESAFESERSSDDTGDQAGSILEKEWRVYNSGLAHMRYGHDLYPRLRPEVFVGLSYDEFLYLEQRWILGVGPRIAVAAQETFRTHVGISWMWEYERSNPRVVVEDPDRQLSRLSTYTSAGVAVGESMELGATVYLQPALTNWADYRVLADVLWTVELGSRWETGIEVEARYDSDPPSVTDGHPNLTEWNGAVSIVLLYEFG